MAKKTVNIGTSANKGNGDPLRTAFGKINDNFDELYAQTGDDVQIPAQATHTGKFLTTNGTTLSWASGDGDRLVKGVHTVSLGTDGMLTLPNGLALPGGAGIFGDATGGYQITDSANSSYVTFDAGGLQLDTYDGSNIRLRTTPVGTADYKDWVFNSNGNLSFPDGSNQITAYTGSAQNIASEDAVNIDVNLTDSTLRRWRFGEDGNLTFPNGMTMGDLDGAEGIQGSADTLIGIISQGTSGSANLQWVDDPEDATAVAAVIVNSLLAANTGTVQIITGDVGPVPEHSWTFGTDGSLTLPDQGPILFGGNNCQIQAQQGFLISSDGGIVVAVTDKQWQFGPDGSLTIPGDIKSENAINIDINLSDSTLRRWSFGEDGNLETPGGIQVAGILKIDDGVHEKLQTKADATGTVTHDCSLGHIFYHTSPDANWTANFTNLNLSTTYATSVTLIIVQGATGYYPSAVQIGGAAQTINWQGNVNPTVSSSRTDVVTFSIINNSGTYTVLGQLTGF
jgi:hypothetical protein